MTARQTKIQIVLVLGVFLIAGLMMMFFGCPKLFRTKRFLDGAKFTDGVIVEMARMPGGKPAFQPVFRFSDVGGAEWTVKEMSGSSSPRYTVGQNVPVAYSPTDPMRARINTIGTLWGIPIFLTTMGFCFTVVSGIGFSWALFESKHHKPSVT